MSKKSLPPILLKSAAPSSAEQKHFSIEPHRLKGKARTGRTKRSIGVVSTYNKAKIGQPRTRKPSISLKENREKALAAVAEAAAAPTPNPDEILCVLQLHGSEEIKRVITQLSPQGRQELGTAFLFSVATSRFLNRIHQRSDKEDPEHTKKVNGYRLGHESNSEQSLGLISDNIRVYNAPMPGHPESSITSSQLTAEDISNAINQLIAERRASYESNRGRPSSRFELVREFVNSGKTKFSLTELAELFDTTNPRKTAASTMSTLKDMLDESGVGIRLTSDTTYRFEPDLRD